MRTNSFKALQKRRWLVKMSYGCCTALCCYWPALHGDGSTLFDDAMFGETGALAQSAQAPAQPGAK